MTAPLGSRRATIGVALLLCAAAHAAPAGAAFTPARLVSGDGSLAADYAFDPAMSANGRYVAYSGAQSSVTGIYRKDLGSGSLELVARGDAGGPSISADGRYVSFTTTARLDEADTNGDCERVYVRDMALAADDPSAFTLVSARDGSSESIAYADAATPGCPDGGAVAARGALSADGRRVAFTVVGRSDLAQPGDVATPPRQVAVRDLDTRTTQLVSQTRDSLGGVPAPVPNGATLAVAKQRDAGQHPTSGGTATISADGTTVAWMGTQVPAQAPVGPAFPPIPPRATPTFYAEPLWRRIADGPTAPTRRVLGGDDPEACPVCTGPLDTSFNFLSAIAETPPVPNYGTFVSTLGQNVFASRLEAVTPRLSADGMTVALLSNQPTYEERRMLMSAPAINMPTANAYVVDMRPGLTRQQAVRRLTSWASFQFGESNVARNGPIASIAISPDGTRVAFTTKRIAFPLSPPALVSAPLAQVVADELYQVNLVAGTMSLASIGYDGNPAAGDVLGLSYAGDSRTLAFSTTAPNLVYGGVNVIQRPPPDASAVLALAEVEIPTVPGEPIATPPPRHALPAPSWRIGATARRTRTGQVLVDVTVPGAGRLAGAASASIRLAGAGRSSTARRRRGAKARAQRRRSARARVVRRTVARSATVAGSAGVVRIRLSAARAYRPLTRTRHGLDATLSVRFTARGRPALRTRLPVRFHVAPKRRKPTTRGPVRR